MSGSARDIKRRIQSVENTHQITKAMEMVAASKMRRAQERALNSRPYALSAMEMLAEVSDLADSKLHPLLTENDSDTVDVVLISTDKGLCGGLNTKLFEKLESFMDEEGGDVSRFKFIVVGKKAVQYAEREGLQVVESFQEMGDKPELSETYPISRHLLEDFEKGRCGKVVVVYTNFISTLRQRPIARRILPFSTDVLKEIVEDIVPDSGKYSDIDEDKTEAKKGGAREFIFEPSADDVLEDLITRLVDVQIYSTILEANASEHSARMMAMKSASDNAEELVEELTLSYNKARQAAITQEIAEISACKTALESG